MLPASSTAASRDGKGAYAAVVEHVITNETACHLAHSDLLWNLFNVVELFVPILSLTNPYFYLFIR